MDKACNLILQTRFRGDPSGLLCSRTFSFSRLLFPSNDRVFTVRRDICAPVQLKPIHHFVIQPGQ